MLFTVAQDAIKGPHPIWYEVVRLEEVEIL